jgi:hypothetical protein
MEYFVVKKDGKVVYDGNSRRNAVARLPARDNYTEAGHEVLSVRALGEGIILTSMRDAYKKSNSGVEIMANEVNSIEVNKRDLQRLNAFFELI